MAFLTLGFGLAGCHVYDENLVSGHGGDGGADLRHAPPRPTTPDGPDMEPLTAALRDPVIIQNDVWQEIGLDLDGYATTVDDTSQECLPPDPQGTPQPDGNDGIDNVFGSGFASIVTLVIPDLQEEARAAQFAGNGTLIIRMEKWNGTDNDPLVHVTISQAVDGTSADPSLVEFNDNYELVMKSDGSQAPPPAWEGNDHWWVRDDTFVEGNPSQPLIDDDAAYVANNQVVLRLPDRVKILFFVGDLGVQVSLTGATSIGTMNAEHTALTDIIVAGRWAEDDLILTADNIGVCAGTQNRKLLTSTIERIADVRSQVGSGGAGVSCDAISLGMRFEAGVLGTWEDVAPAPPLPNPCASAGGDGGT